VITMLLRNMAQKLHKCAARGLFYDANCNVNILWWILLGKSYSYVEAVISMWNYLLCCFCMYSSCEGTINEQVTHWLRNVFTGMSLIPTSQYRREANTEEVHANINAVVKYVRRINCNKLKTKFLILFWEYGEEILPSALLLPYLFLFVMILLFLYEIYSEQGYELAGLLHDNQ
jgi:hypothetical protein